MDSIQSQYSKKELLVTHMPSLYGNDIEAKRAELLSYFHKTFTLNEKLYECLKNEDSFLSKGSPLRHPLMFYFGHTAVFYINKLFVAGLIPERVDAEKESTFAIGVDEMSWDDLNNNNYNWPTISEVKEYRNKVRHVVSEFIKNTPLTLPIQWDDPFWIINMGIEHERIHIETSSVLIRELPIEKVKSVDLFTICPESKEPPKNSLVKVEGKEITLGKLHDDKFYGWDNEYGQKTKEVKSFKASKFLVSNREYFEFMADDGYQTEEYWSVEGWKWKEYTGAQFPHFWVKFENSYKYRTLTEEINMPWDWPVDINYLEAKAFCEWKSKKTNTKIRMPTEAEWMVLRDKLDTDQPLWENAPGNINLEYWASSSPVDYFESHDGLYDIVGNVWQWTESPMAALPGFKVHPYYDDFSVPTFDQKHNIIKGGSFFSTGNYALKESRYAFRRHFFQHAGLRYIQTEEPVQIEAVNPYETDDVINQYMEFQYGDNYFSIENFAKNCASISMSHMEGKAKSKALDLGCAVGRLSFELAQCFDHVDGIDFSARFVQSAVAMQNNGFKKYKIPVEGSIYEYKQAELAKLGLKETANKCRFMQGDACNLDQKYTGYDLIFAGNLIDRLYSPSKFLQTIHEKLNTGGTLILTSPYTWLEEYTPESEWLGGFKKSGENQMSLQGLKEQLSAKFNFVRNYDVPFVIRETARKYQHTVADLSVWELK